MELEALRRNMQTMTHEASAATPRRTRTCTLVSASIFNARFPRTSAPRTLLQALCLRLVQTSDVKNLVPTREQCIQESTDQPALRSARTYMNKFAAVPATCAKTRISRLVSHIFEFCRERPRRVAKSRLGRSCSPWMTYQVKIVQLVGKS